ncbi:amidohydrolase family protein [Paenibacillus eucommiae]|uniref:TIM-barrel fold metal-dependent hydrolase n=1 Tax=Paenibacillus eucommiae TaxID=1355755 RepID=A0ABS4IM02_9BACL|nr:amidohydrolase family protein [Paenibacillus eucommiae]MBP1988593.1 putative TIM-barrel fold metal-dependent hydrolase [Paenibacillus eucommiae]
MNKLIIDSHLHVFFSQSQPWRPQVEETLHHMEMAGIKQTCLLPNPQWTGTYFPSKDEMLFQAEALSEITNAFPGRFLPLLFICPLLPYDFTLDLMEQYILKGPLIGAKFHVSLYADDDRYEPIYNYLERHDLPLLFHAWYKTVENYAYESTPSQIAEVARRHPDLRILMAHLTGSKLRGIMDIKKYPNVCIDTSGSQPEEGYLQRALEELGPDRVLYGSDYPIRAFSTQLARIESVDMSEEVREKVLQCNAQRFFHKGAAQ